MAPKCTSSAATKPPPPSSAPSAAIPASSPPSPTPTRNQTRPNRNQAPTHPEVALPANCDTNATSGPRWSDDAWAALERVETYGVGDDPAPVDTHNIRGGVLGSRRVCCFANPTTSQCRPCRSNSEPALSSTEVT